MPNYIIAYLGEANKPNSPQEGKAQMGKWQSWVAGLGDAVINPGSPMGKSNIVSAKGVSSDDKPNRMTGFSVVKADNFEIALEMAQACPYVEFGGTLQVAELIEMKH
ncbi:MAG: hypothetical protein HQL71_10785 [Magnetococcales bacterium]|nr:hypothetical protein [Magnetococcales bacterium]